MIKSDRDELDFLLWRVDDIVSGLPQVRDTGQLRPYEVITFRIWLIALVILALLGFAALAQAQTVVNPTTFGFDHTDFALTTDYEFGYFADATVTTPIQSGIAPKPATCSPCTGPLPARPTAFQTWYVAVRARVGTVAPYVYSDWSVRIPFSRLPAVPINLIAK